MDDLRIESVKKTGFSSSVLYKQYFEGIPVLGSILISFDRNNDIKMVQNYYKENISLDLKKIKNFVELENLIRKQYNFNSSEIELTRKSKFIVEKDNEYTIVFDFRFTEKTTNQDQSFLIDGETGEIIENSQGVSTFLNNQSKVFSPDPRTFNKKSVISENDISNAYNIKNLSNLDQSGYVRGTYAESTELTGPSGNLISDGNFVKNRDEIGFKEVNIYYHINNIQEYIHSIGFNPKWFYAPGQYKKSKIRFDARGSISGFAAYDHDNDREHIIFDVFYTPEGVPFSGEDQSIIVHEFGHALHDALIQDGISHSQLLKSYFPIAEAIGEGMADYFNISYRRNMEKPSGSFYRPNDKSNWTAENIAAIKTPSNAKYPNHWSGSAHNKGIVWASALMDIEYNNSTNPSLGDNLGRDITTKLVLHALNDVTIASDITDNVFAILKADVDLYNGIHLSNLNNIFENRGLLIHKVFSDTTFTEDQVWAGDIEVNGNITINNNAKLTILEGTTIQFQYGKKIIVNGELEILGSINNKTRLNFTSHSGGIQFNSGSEGLVDNTIISGAFWGVFVNSATVSVTNSEIYNCDYGIVLNYTNYSSGTKNYNNNYIHHCSYKGFSFTLSGGNLNSNSIKYNSNSSNTGMGIYCTYLSSPSIGNGGGNDVKYNNIGLYTYNNLNYTLGSGNNFTSNYQYHIKAVKNCTIYAYNNFYPSSNQYFCSEDGSSITSSFGTFTNCSTDPTLSKLSGSELVLDKNNTKDSLFAIQQLSNLWFECSNNNEIDIFKSYLHDLISKNRNNEITAFADYILTKYDSKNKKNNLLNLLKKYNYNHLAELIRYDLFIDFLMNDEIKEARKYLKELTKYSPNSELSKDAKRYFVKFEGKELIKETSEQMSFIEKDIKEEYFLRQNYPNPFNPSTIISYAIKDAGFVNLTIYNSLGQKVAVLVNEHQNIGNYNEIFNATKLPNGIYFYTLKANKWSNTRKMLLLK